MHEQRDRRKVERNGRRRQRSASDDLGSDGPGLAVPRRRLIQRSKRCGGTFPGRDVSNAPFAVAALSHAEHSLARTYSALRPCGGADPRGSSAPLVNRRTRPKRPEMRARGRRAAVARPGPTCTVRPRPCASCASGPKWPPAQGAVRLRHCRPYYNPPPRCCGRRRAVGSMPFGLSSGCLGILDHALVCPHGSGRPIVFIICPFVPYFFAIQLYLFYIHKSSIVSYIAMEGH